jgi:SNF2 family DNA or RNA helicase
MLSSSNEDKAFFRKLKLEYCVYDEAHMLKNMNSIRYQSLIKINSRRRLLLTGTPLQNNLVELMSLLYFVMPDIFEHKTEHLKRIFETKPADVDKDTFYSEKIAQAKGIMRPFIMRRLKTDVLKQLPQKVIKVLECEQTTRQLAEYEKLISVYRERKEADAKKVEEIKTSKAIKGDKKGRVGLEEGRVPSIVEECNELKNLNIKSNANEDETSKIGYLKLFLDHLIEFKSRFF